MKTTPLLLCLLGFVSASVSPLQAHTVWIEPLPNGLLGLRFGEWGEAPETSPGHLDSLTTVSAKVGDAAQEAEAAPSKQSDHFVIPGSQATSVATGRAGYPVMARGGTARRPVFYARWWPASRPLGKATHTLDLVPVAVQPVKVLVSFHGQPLAAGVELTFYRPDEKEIKITTDASGHVTLPDTANAGLCLLTLGRHAENQPGAFEGKPYDVLSHSASLCWRVEK